MIAEKEERDPLERSEDGKQWTLLHTDGTKKKLSQRDSVLLEIAYNQGYKKKIDEIVKRD